MNDDHSLSISSPPSAIVLPAPRCGEIGVRLATIADIPFIDELQKKHQKMLGWTPRKTIEGKIAAGHILVAEGLGVRGQGLENANSDLSSLAPSPSPLAPAVPLGYCISQDRYMGRDDCGVIYQLNVAPVEQRKLIGATLVKTVFERAAYGCRLFCCWCAQDIAANYFWEAMGFVPLAFRAGNRAKGRVHIFWQRRIREGDTTTPYWFPAETRGGMMNEARLVLPIPPGTGWKDAKPVVLPGATTGNPNVETRNPKQIRNSKSEIQNRHSTSRTQDSAVRTQHCTIGQGGLRFVAPEPAKIDAPKAKRTVRRPKAKNDPRHVAAARELRDRWMEEINSGRYLPETTGKYDVSRAISDQRSAISLGHSPLPLLLAA